MKSQLTLTHERDAVCKGDDYISYVTTYENDGYKVSIIEEKDELIANVVRKSYEFPNISIKYGGVNIPALGVLSETEIDDFIDKVIFAKETYLQVLDIINR